MTYDFVDAVSSSLVLVAVYYYLKGKRPNENHEIRKIIMETSVIFWDTAAWFGLMATVAGLLYFFGRARSFYEYTLALIVTYEFVNAGILALWLSSTSWSGATECTSTRATLPTRLAMRTDFGSWHTSPERLGLSRPPSSSRKSRVSLLSSKFLSQRCQASESQKTLLRMLQELYEPLATLSLLRFPS